MTQEFNLKGLEDFPSHFLIASLTALRREDEESFNKIALRGKKGLDIEFRVNGIELDFEATLNNWYERVQENLKYQAYELVKEKVELKGILDSVDEFNEKIKEFEDELDKKLRELFGVEFESEED